MKTGWFVGFAMAFSILTLILGLLEMGFVGTDETAVFQTLFNPFTVGPATWIGAVWNVVTFNYIFFDGSWELVRYIFCWPISAGFVFGLVVALAQALGSVLGGVFRVIGAR